MRHIVKKYVVMDEHGVRAEYDNPAPATTVFNALYRPGNPNKLCIIEREYEFTGASTYTSKRQRKD
jgi:hypothetical protein